uniref:Uncharacterized protein n=1 Tax=Molossus molossus TaxID=27622 RepID=A0A7J8JW68_MOLMO|nr:hypothetical protein HJG59_007807 [Molossus molossus]
MYLSLGVLVHSSSTHLLFSTFEGNRDLPRMVTAREEKFLQRRAGWFPEDLESRRHLSRWPELEGVEDMKNRVRKKAEVGHQRILGDREKTTVVGAGDSWREKRRPKVLGRTQIVDIGALAYRV